MPYSYFCTSRSWSSWGTTLSRRRRKPGVVEHRPAQRQEVGAEVGGLAGPEHRPRDPVPLDLVQRQRLRLTGLGLEQPRGHLQRPEVAGPAGPSARRPRRAAGAASSCRWRAAPRRTPSRASQPTSSRASRLHEPKSCAPCRRAHDPRTSPSSRSSCPGCMLAVGEDVDVGEPGQLADVVDDVVVDQAVGVVRARTGRPGAAGRRARAAAAALGSGSGSSPRNRPSTR